MNITDTLIFIVITLVLFVLAYYIIDTLLGSCNCNKPYWAHTQSCPMHPMYKEKTHQIYRCEQTLNKPFKHHVEGASINERPAFVDFPSICQSPPKFDPNLAMKGTGVGEPAFEDVNEFPAPFSRDCQKCVLPKPSNFDPKPSDGNDNEQNEKIDYHINQPRVSGFVCLRPSGVGEPAFEKQNEFNAEI